MFVVFCLIGRDTATAAWRGTAVDALRAELNGEWERRWREREAQFNAQLNSGRIGGSADSKARAAASFDDEVDGVKVIPVQLADLLAAAGAPPVGATAKAAPSAAAAPAAAAAASASAAEMSGLERRLSDTERGVAELRTSVDAFVSRVQRDVADIALATRQSVLSMAR